MFVVALPSPITGKVEARSSCCEAPLFRYGVSGAQCNDCGTVAIVPVDELTPALFVADALTRELAPDIGHDWHDIDRETAYGTTQRLSFNIRVF